MLYSNLNGRKSNIGINFSVPNKIISFFISAMDTRLQHPFSCIIAGASGSGKTVFVTKLIEHVQSMIDPPPEKIIWHYGEWQSLFETMPNVEFVEGLPDPKQYDGTRRSLVIIDDLMNETNRSITDLFTKGSHHRNLSVIHIVQNLFSRNKEHRTISLNAHYLVIFKNPRDNSQILHLAKQAYPSRPKVLQEAFLDATSKPYGYLLLDFKQNTQEEYRLRSQIFPNETNFVYVPR